MEPRTIFTRQPARILLIDISKEFENDTLCHLHECLENFFSLVCSLSGPVRLPFFGLFALGSYPEALFPLQHIKGNFTRIQSALFELMSFHQDQKSHNNDHYRGISTPLSTSTCVMQGVLEAINMFKRQAQGLLQTAGYSSQLEITVLTMSNAQKVTQNVEMALKQVNLDSLKVVSVVSVWNPDHLQSLNEDIMMSQCGSNSDTSSNSEVTGAVEINTVENDVCSLENYFRRWLHDVDTDKEHIHIKMPPCKEGEESLVLRCDLQESMLNPGFTPFHNRFCLPIDSTIPKGSSVTGSKTNHNNTVPVYQLLVIKKLSIESLCESILYGLPQLVKATSCWKIDWDELETNQQNFLAVCKVLQQENECLLVKLDRKDDINLRTSKSRQKTNFRYNIGVPQPEGHFILMPSNNGTMLLKSVAVRELMMPCDYPAIQVPGEQVVNDIKQILSQVESDPTYNPILYESGLCRSLTYQLCNQSSGQCKRKAQSGVTNFNQITSAYGRGSRAVDNSSTSWGNNSLAYKQARQRNQLHVYNSSSGEPQEFPTEL